ncbi:Rtc4p Ecym_1102 [Eremothecium cymbalariae DBVPG|uniref:Restriction of telomere capping protein 4 n=1 Tax=Eremothecium cymbalariae (strain CBS 270.75 / DBVPG 7215 / KCTC 17166 / NRRL Y-17582) TaxID=931890 RepID=G8JMK4_ERECY|nr:hypothetical protein Ecym_1102 [Eremothecium cymbalariae DBVPG\
MVKYETTVYSTMMANRIMSLRGLRSKRNNAIYGKANKDENSLLFKTHSYGERSQNLTQELSDNDYASSNSSPPGPQFSNKFITDSNLDVDSKYHGVGTSSSDDKETRNGSYPSSPIASSGDGSDQFSIQDNVPLPYKVPEENIQALEVAARLKDIHEAVEHDDNDSPGDHLSKKMVFSDMQDEVAQYEHMLKVRLRYQKDFKVPRTLFSDQLMEKATKHIYIVDEILKGSRVSMYYDNARKAFKKSSRALLSVDEFRTMDLKWFTAGYFGLKRQIRLSSEVLNRYREVLSTHVNPTVRWWGPTDFCRYVLAPEILSYVCKEEMGFTDIDDAWTFMENTAEYGLIVADEEPLETWEIEFEQKKLDRLGLDSRYGSMHYRQLPASGAELETSNTERKRRNSCENGATENSQVSSVSMPISKRSKLTTKIPTE